MADLRMIKKGFINMKTSLRNKHMDLKKDIKQLLIYMIYIIVSSLTFYAVHVFLLTSFLDLGTNSLIREQHVFLSLLVLFVYGMVAVVYKVSPIHAAYVLMGLLLAKMILAGMFVYKLGWLDDSETMHKRAVFLVFYLMYSFVLVLMSSKIIKNIGSKE
ncbi:hypothetical protein HN014_07335 [Aquimarina sp. TRL1]|uniref:hypothetical protein n=1 Tax=Aquimarina sp. (strain TRL1) TaxID=2736252 RepID=UPI0015889E47|nr:hypothetical protein [Aquimarina sp. TRL1]QKX04731.1 hypothetical protein HN014_07335 [Aquimarina sp. TRL1]